MKKVISITLFLVLQSILFAQNITLKARVDERCELLSTIFRLMESEEYVTTTNPNYTDDLNSYFEVYKNHELIQYLKKYRKTNGIGYDAPMNLATHIQIVNGKISLIDGIKKTSIDSRWDKNTLTHIIQLLNDFYTESQFNKFFISQTALIEKTAKKATEYFENIDMKWYEKFYGDKPRGTFNLIISLSNGYNNYGVKVSYLSNKEDIYAIIGCDVDSLNNPIFDESSLELVIHEFCHSFCNHLIDENYDQMQKKADKFFNLKKGILSDQAYTNSKIMLYEILVRASVIKYMSDHYSINLNRYFGYEKGYGFIWIEELYNRLLDYEKNRIQYPTLSSYMPEIVKAQNKLKPKKLLKDQERQKPLMSIKNIKYFKKDVDCEGITKIILSFDQAMSTGVNGMSYGKKGKEFFPEIVSVKWNEETKKEWIIEMKLESKKEYSISFPSHFFLSKNGVNPRNTINLDFKTK